MKSATARYAATGLLVLTAASFSPPLEAQSPGDVISRAYRSCTLIRQCNWTSHALIAFGTTFALNSIGVPTIMSASAAALVYVGKEVRDHLKWGVLGSPDSNGDMASGVVGAMIAYHLIRPAFRSSQAAIGVQVRDRAWFTIRIASP